MHPILFKVFGIPVYTYGFMMAVSFLICISLACRRAVKEGISPHDVIDLGLYILVSGIVGARLLYVLMNFSYYISNLKEIILLQKGGLSYFGGLFSGLIIGIIFIRKKKLPIAKMSDLIFLFLPLGHAIARIGCFLNGCCYGKPSSIFCAVEFPPGSIPLGQYGDGVLLHPVQLYSVLMNLCIFIILNFMKKTFEGELIYDYMIMYGFGRFFMEYFRAEHPVIWHGLNVFQIVCLTVFTAGVILRFIIKRHVRKSV